MSRSFTPTQSVTVLVADIVESDYPNWLTAESVLTEIERIREINPRTNQPWSISQMRTALNVLTSSGAVIRRPFDHAIYNDERPNVVRRHRYQWNPGGENI